MLLILIQTRIADIIVQFPLICMLFFHVIIYLLTQLILLIVLTVLSVLRAEQ